jgi:hypothetical protein
MVKPINVHDPRYLSEVVPPGIKALGAALRAEFHRPPIAFGDKGNEKHDFGYHRSANWILHSPDSRRGANDGSVNGALNQGGDPNWICAFDFTPADENKPENKVLMKAITQRVLDAAKARDPRLADVAQFAGTIDGDHVITFRGFDGAPLDPFDRTHLTHVHGSIFRSRAANDHTGIFEVMIGEDMGLTAAQNNALAEVWATLVSIRDGKSVTGVPSHPAGPSWLVTQVNALAAATAQSAQREQDMLTALSELAKNSPSVNTADIVAAINARTTDVTALVSQQSARILELEQELAQLHKAAEANPAAPGSNLPESVAVAVEE